MAQAVHPAPSAPEQVKSQKEMTQWVGLNSDVAKAASAQEQHDAGPVVASASSEERANTSKSPTIAPQIQTPASIQNHSCSMTDVTMSGGPSVSVRRQEHRSVPSDGLKGNLVIA
jgi:hypothetical protein